MVGPDVDEEAVVHVADADKFVVAVEEEYGIIDIAAMVPEAMRAIGPVSVQAWESVLPALMLDPFHALMVAHGVEPVVPPEGEMLFVVALLLVDAMMFFVIVTAVFMVALIFSGEGGYRHQQKH
jgi:hypothetical protein